LGAKQIDLVLRCVVLSFSVFVVDPFESDCWLTLQNFWSSLIKLDKTQLMPQVMRFPDHFTA
jgi:hypothetical protein